MKTLPTIISAFLLLNVTLVHAANNCRFAISKASLTLQNSCTTDSSLVVPNGGKLDLNGFTVTAVNPPGGHFKGGVIINGGSSAYVSNGTITSSNLADVCEAGADRLRGILFDGASGAISDLHIVNMNMNQGRSLSGCQEGNGIEVRNFGSSPTTITIIIEENTIIGYQKTGIMTNGDTFATITGNTVVGNGPQGVIAQNGIQVGYGATAHVKHNRISGNSYTGDNVSGGIVIPAGPYYNGSPFSVGDQISENFLDGNDIGVWLTQRNADRSPSATATNAKVADNTITNNAKTSGYVYQAGIADEGNGDKLINNEISGAGYNNSDRCGCLFAIDFDPASPPTIRHQDQGTGDDKDKNK